jgi:hypothetical protein
MLHAKADVRHFSVRASVCQAHIQRATIPHIERSLLLDPSKRILLQLHVEIVYHVRKYKSHLRVRKTRQLSEGHIAAVYLC